MSKARHPRSYVKGPRKQMTRAWKLRVHEALAENDKTGKKPASVAELAKMLRGGKGADKAGLYRTLEIDGTQTASVDVDEICAVLEIPAPLIQSDDDGELQRDLDLIRSLLPEARRELMTIARRMPRRE